MAGMAATGVGIGITGAVIGDGAAIGDGAIAGGVTVTIATTDSVLEMRPGRPRILGIGIERNGKIMSRKSV